jgi:hypothetical protein
MKAAAPKVVRCEACQQLGAKAHMDPHHPQGRHGENLLRFIWVHRHCHDLIHNNPEVATRLKLMIPNR